MRNFFKSRWFTYCVLVLGGGTIFKLSSLKDAFYVPMQENSMEPPESKKYYASVISAPMALKNVEKTLQ